MTLSLERGNATIKRRILIHVCSSVVGVRIWSLAIPLASRSYAQARLGHIDREKERGGGSYNVAKRDAITQDVQSRQRAG